MEHTPGPWEVREGGSEVFGPAIYTLDAHETADPLAATDHIDPNADANARLIAAAPELLRALELLINGMGMGTAGHIEHAERVIAKARGIATAPPAEAEGASR